jgi:hypothetical protein
MIVGIFSFIWPVPFLDLAGKIFAEPYAAHSFKKFRAF